MKKARKILSMLLAIVLIVTTIGSSVFAQKKGAQDTQNITVDGKNYSIETTYLNPNTKKVVVTEENGNKNTVVYNEKTGNMSIDSFDSSSSINNQQSFNVNDFNTTQLSSPVITTQSYQGIINSNSTIWWDYSYYIHYYTNPTKYNWSMYIPNDHKIVTQTTYNYITLYNFMAVVDDMDFKQGEFLAAVGTAIAGVAVGILTAPSGIGIVIGVIAALGGSSAAAVLYWEAYCLRDTANFYFMQAN